VGQPDPPDLRHRGDGIGGFRELEDQARRSLGRAPTRVERHRLEREQRPIRGGIIIGTVRRRLWKVRTDLNSFSKGEIACLENHGYTLADAAVRSSAPAALCQIPGAQFQWPHSDWTDGGKCLAALTRSHKRAILRHIFRLIYRLGNP
jgi:hypothetical protein